MPENILKSGYQKEEFLIGGNFTFKTPDLPESGSENPDSRPEAADETGEEKESVSEKPGQAGVPIDAGESKEADESKEESEEEVRIPERPKDAMTGTQFAENLKKMEGDIAKKMKLEGKTRDEILLAQYRAREQAIYEQVVTGNIPAKMREMKDVQISTVDKSGNRIEGTIKVMPDYLMVGSDEDAIRVPMTPATAQLIARQFNCTLPTDKMVDAIAAEAKRNGVTLNPTPKPEHSKFARTEYFVEHEMQIRHQIEKRGIDGNPLIVGTKKDIVIPYGADGANHVVIYGWHNPDGSKIQPYSGPHHEWSYLDYSHGVRLVAKTMTIRYPDGRVEKNKDIHDVLADKELSSLLARAPVKNAGFAYRHPGVVKEIDISLLKPSAAPAGEDKSTTDKQEKTAAEEKAPQGTKDSDAQEPSPVGVPGVPEETAQPASSGASGASGIASSSPAATPSQNTDSGYSDQDPAPAPSTGSSSMQFTPPATSQAPAQLPSAPAQSPPAGQPYASPPSAETPPESAAVPPAVPSAPGGAEKMPGFKKAKNPYEFSRTNDVPPLQGETGFFGDSINTKITDAKYLSGQAHEYFAKGGERTKWLLEDKIPKHRDEIKRLKRAVVLIGTNDIGMGGSETPDVIFSRIEKIWELILFINPNIKLYACTIPPFGNYSGYSNRKHIVDKRRSEINAKIRAAAKANPAIKLIDLCLPVEEGGLAASGHPPDGDAMDKSVCWEPLHPDKNALAMVYGRAIHNHESTNQTVATESAEPPRQADRREVTQKSPVSGNFEKTSEFNEYVQTYNYPETSQNALKVHINKPGDFNSSKPTRVIVYALPAGNTISQTVGKTKSPGEDWHFDIQHIGAQTRKLREMNPGENIVVAYVQGPQNSINAWLKTANNGKNILEPLLDDIKTRTGAPHAKISLSGHSAGGGLTRALVENSHEIPDSITRISFLDSINQFSAEKYGEKVLKWLRKNSLHRLTVVSYDDREALLKGKPFPGRGSSYARTIEMVEFLKKSGVALNEENKNGYKVFTGMNGQVSIAIFNNPRRAILHTETVRRNGFIFAETSGTTLQNSAPLNGRLAYQNLIQRDTAKA